MDLEGRNWRKGGRELVLERGKELEGEREGGS